MPQSIFLPFKILVRKIRGWINLHGNILNFQDSHWTYAWCFVFNDYCMFAQFKIPEACNIHNTTLLPLFSTVSKWHLRVAQRRRDQSSLILSSDLKITLNHSCTHMSTPPFQVNSVQGHKWPLRLHWAFKRVKKSNERIATINKTAQV